MKELDKYKAVNSSETVEALQAAILSFADKDGMIQGRTRKFNAEWMADKVPMVLIGLAPIENMTREYGIRQQVLMFMFYISPGYKAKLEAEFFEKLNKDISKEKDH